MRDKIVLVKWVDAKFCSGIHTEEEAANHEMSVFESIGYLVSKTKLATKLSHNRNRYDIKKLMELARDRTGKTPKVVLTDGWKGYLDGIELAYGADAKHVQTTPFGSKADSTTLIERWHGTLKDRTKVMRGMKSLDTAKAILEGWLVYYNFARPHKTLANPYPRTPAMAAGITDRIWTLEDIVRLAS